MDNNRVLLVEDDADLRVTTRLVLERHGFEVTTAEDGVAALECLQSIDVDIAVVDVMMPRLDGLSLTKRLRDSPRHGLLPIILLTARDLPHDQVSGLGAGADDYVTKPFDGDILVARMRALLRRAGSAEPSVADVETVGDLVIDRAGMVVSRGGERIDLSATEFRLLTTFLDHLGAVLSREQLLAHVWGSATWGDARVVDVNIQRLRSKIGHDRIETFRGAGYKMVRS